MEDTPASRATSFLSTIFPALSPPDRSSHCFSVCSREHNSTVSPACQSFFQKFLRKTFAIRIAPILSNRTKLFQHAWFTIFHHKKASVYETFGKYKSQNQGRTHCSVEHYYDLDRLRGVFLAYRTLQTPMLQTTLRHITNNYKRTQKNHAVFYLNDQTNNSPDTVPCLSYNSTLTVSTNSLQLNYQTKCNTL